MNPNLSDLEKLAELREKGILTEEEFQTKKKQILNESSNQNISFENKFQTNQNIPNKPVKKKTGCLKISLITFGAFILMTAITAIFSPEDKNAKKQITNDEFLMSNKPKNQQQKIDSAKLANEKFQSLSYEEKIASLEKELENKKLSKTEKKEIELEIRSVKVQEFQEKHISSWDGSNRDLVNTVKKSMNDPNSFEHVQTSFDYKDNSVKAKMIYRGNNAFGAKVLGKVIGKIDYNGNLLSVETSN